MVPQEEPPARLGVSPGGSLKRVECAVKVLSVASEMYPLIKTGGLADVTGALPYALAHHGVEMRVLLPGYPGVLESIEHCGKAKPLDLPLGAARVQRCDSDGVSV